VNEPTDQREQPRILCGQPSGRIILVLAIVRTLRTTFWLLSTTSKRELDYLNSDTVTEGGLTGRLPCDPAYTEIVAVVRIPTYASRRSAFNASDIGSDFRDAAVG
jgi:hypothetical protein